MATTAESISQKAKERTAAVTEAANISPIPSFPSRRIELHQSDREQQRPEVRAARPPRRALAARAAGHFERRAEIEAQAGNHESPDEKQQSGNCHPPDQSRHFRKRFL